MANMRDMVRDNTKAKKEYTPASEWPRCSAHGCPMMSTVKAANTVCQFHHGHNMGVGGSTWNAITEAIISHKGLIQKYANLVYTPASDWDMNRMMGWEAFKMEEGEIPSLYMTRLNLWIHKEINESATELLQ